MTRIRHTDGPARFNHRSFSGISTHGDEHDVSDEAADYLCDELGYFERAGEVTDVEFQEVEDGPDYTKIPPNLEDATYDELMEVARDFDIAGRSSMDKAELIAALQEE